MDERSVLLAQIQALTQELTRAENALDVPQIDANLSDRVRVRFDRLIREQQAALSDVRKQAKDGQPLDECWVGFRYVREGCAPLFREYLALIEGAMVRSAGLDNSVCQIADALLNHLSHRADIYWGRFTILAGEEFFADMAEVIRIRFPETSIWNLPVAAHEFGHFIGPKLEVREPDGSSRHPFQVLLERESRQGSRYWSYMHEYFADLFATYSLGPAYACTCLLLRFDPRAVDGEQHPNTAQRAYLILRTLDKMNVASGRLMQPFSGIISLLEDSWRRSLRATGESDHLGQEMSILMDERLEELYSLTEPLLGSVKYGGWLQANRIADELLLNSTVRPQLQTDDTIADILNAAWLVRVEHWDEDGYPTGHIGDRAIELCQEYIRRKSGTGRN
jgi:hypothetical protein